MATGINKVQFRHIVNQQTYLLVDHVQSVGDYGQHQTEPVDIGFAAALCLSAIELAHRLTKELP